MKFCFVLVLFFSAIFLSAALPTPRRINEEIVLSRLRRQADHTGMGTILQPYGGDLPQIGTYNSGYYNSVQYQPSAGSNSYGFFG